MQVRQGRRVTRDQLNATAPYHMEGDFLQIHVVGGILFRDAQTEDAISNNDAHATRDLRDVVNYGS